MSKVYNWHELLTLPTPGTIGVFKWLGKVKRLPEVGYEVGDLHLFKKGEQLYSIFEKDFHNIKIKFNFDSENVNISDKLKLIKIDGYDSHYTHNWLKQRMIHLNYNWKDLCRLPNPKVEIPYILLGCADSNSENSCPIAVLQSDDKIVTCNWSEKNRFNYSTLKGDKLDISFDSDVDFIISEKCGKFSMNELTLKSGTGVMEDKSKATNNPKCLESIKDLNKLSNSDSLAAWRSGCQYQILGNTKNGAAILNLNDYKIYQFATSIDNFYKNYPDNFINDFIYKDDKYSCEERSLTLESQANIVRGVHYLPELGIEWRSEVKFVITEESLKTLEKLPIPPVGEYYHFSKEGEITLNGRQSYIYRSLDTGTLYHDTINVAHNCFSYSGDVSVSPYVPSRLLRKILAAKLEFDFANPGIFYDIKNDFFNTEISEQLKSLNGIDNLVKIQESDKYDCFILGKDIAYNYMTKSLMKGSGGVPFNLAEENVQLLSSILVPKPARFNKHDIFNNYFCPTNGKIYYYEAVVTDVNIKGDLLYICRDLATGDISWTAVEPTGNFFTRDPNGENGENISCSWEGLSSKCKEKFTKLIPFGCVPELQDKLAYSDFYFSYHMSLNELRQKEINFALTQWDGEKLEKKLSTNPKDVILEIFTKGDLFYNFTQHRFECGHENLPKFNLDKDNLKLLQEKYSASIFKELSNIDFDKISTCSTDNAGSNYVVAQSGDNKLLWVKDTKKFIYCAHTIVNSTIGEDINGFSSSIAVSDDLNKLGNKAVQYFYGNLPDGDYRVIAIHYHLNTTDVKSVVLADTSTNIIYDVREKVISKFSNKINFEDLIQFKDGVIINVISYPEFKTLHWYEDGTQLAGIGERSKNFSPSSNNGQTISYWVDGNHCWEVYYDFDRNDLFYRHHYNRAYPPTTRWGSLQGLPNSIFRKYNNAISNSIAQRREELINLPKENVIEGTTNSNYSNEPIVLKPWNGDIKLIPKTIQIKYYIGEGYGIDETGQLVDYCGPADADAYESLPETTVKTLIEWIKSTISCFKEKEVCKIEHEFPLKDLTIKDNYSMNLPTEARAAGYRVAALQVRKAFQNLLLQNLPENLRTLLSSEMGLGLMEWALGYYLDGQEDIRWKQLGEEFRVSAMASVGNSLMEELFNEIFAVMPQRIVMEEFVEEEELELPEEVNYAQI